MKVSRWLFENHPECIINGLMMGVNIGDRRLGKSTGIALSIIGSAMINPNKPIKITEDISSSDFMRDKYLMDMVADIVYKLDLKCFEFSKFSKTVVYKPTVNVELKLVEVE